MSLPVKILIFSAIGLLVVGAIVGPSVYFGLRGKKSVQSLVQVVITFFLMILQFSLL